MPKIAFLFPGQGAQSVGMGRELYAELPAVRALFDRAGEILGIDLTGLCFDGPAEALNATDVSQPALFVASLAALESLKATNPEVVAACQGAAGLSLGEYTALVFAGAIEFEAGLKLVRLRGEAMQAAAVGNPERHGERARARREQGRRALWHESSRSAGSGRQTCSGRATSSSRAIPPRLNTSNRSPPSSAR